MWISGKVTLYALRLQPNCGALGCLSRKYARKQTGAKVLELTRDFMSVTLDGTFPQLNLCLCIYLCIVPAGSCRLFFK